MNVFIGAVTLDGRPIGGEIEDSLRRMTLLLGRGSGVTHRSQSALIVQPMPPSAGNRNASRMGSGVGNMLFAAAARLDNRQELRAALGLAAPEFCDTSDVDLLRLSLQRSGDAGIARCLGAFAFAAWDEDARRLTLGRDCLGNVPLFFCRIGNLVAFATTLRLLLNLPGVPREIDESALANFLVVNTSDRRRTFYRGIERVPSRTLITIDRQEERERHYWAPDLTAPPPYAREEDYIERARELFDQAVAATIRDTPHVAIATSGGLDSSAIAATAARLASATSITCFVLASTSPPTHLSRASYGDERGKVAALGRLYPGLDVRFVEAHRLHPFIEDDTRYFARADLPVLGPASFAEWSHLYDAVASGGYSALLVGNQGNFGLSWPGHFALMTLLRTGRWGRFIRELRAGSRETGRGPLRALFGDVMTPAAPLGLRRWLHRLRGRDPDDVARYSALNPDFIVAHGLRQQWREQGFDPWFGPQGLSGPHHRAYRLFDHNQYSRDVMGMSRSIYGFEHRDPHADRRLLEFALAVPETMYRRDGAQRAFARRVLADRLPAEILGERRYGAHAPSWFGVLDSRRAQIGADIERLAASPLASRLIDVPRLNRLMSQWPKDASAAEHRLEEYRLALTRGIHVGRFIRWVEGANT